MKKSTITLDDKKIKPETINNKFITQILIIFYFNFK